MTLSLIASIGKNNELGRAGELCWRLSDDLKNFKRVTNGHTVIMGRKTFASIGHPLPNRKNIIVTRNPEYTQDGCFIAHSLDDALAIAAGDTEAFVIGGAELFREALPRADRLYITHIDAEDARADAFFPPVDWSAWQKSEEVLHNVDAQHSVAFWMTTYERQAKK